MNFPGLVSNQLPKLFEFLVDQYARKGPGFNLPLGVIVQQYSLFFDFAFS